MTEGCCVGRMLPRDGLTGLSVQHTHEIAEVDDHLAARARRSGGINDDAPQAFAFIPFGMIEERGRTDLGDPDEFGIIQRDQFIGEQRVETLRFGIFAKPLLEVHRGNWERAELELVQDAFELGAELGNQVFECGEASVAGGKLERVMNSLTCHDFGGLGA